MASSDPRDTSDTSTTHTRTISDPVRLWQRSNDGANIGRLRGPVYSA